MGQTSIFAFADAHIVAHDLHADLVRSRLQQILHHYTAVYVHFSGCIQNQPDALYDEPSHCVGRDFSSRPILVRCILPMHICIHSHLCGTNVLSSQVHDTEGTTEHGVV